MNDSSLFLVSKELENNFDESTLIYEKKEKLLVEIIDIQNVCDVLKITHNKKNNIFKLKLKFKDSCKKYYFINKNCNFKILFDEKAYILKDIIMKKINVEKNTIKLEVTYVE